MRRLTFRKRSVFSIFRMLKAIRVRAVLTWAGWTGPVGPGGGKTVSAKGRLPSKLGPGSYRLGLWMPDAYKTIRTDPRYAVRVANRDVPWWTDAKGRYGVNILGNLEVTR